VDTKQTGRTTSSQRLSRLSRQDQAAVESFVRRLREVYGEELSRATLFGSRARGDAREDSDFDFLVVLEVEPDSYWRHWRTVADLAWEVELSMGVAISFVLKTAESYSRMLRRRPLLVREIERDGITLWTSPHAVPMFASA
jgi:predicted nucleotidyltransferase